jgi:hypothetical protein
VAGEQIQTLNRQRRFAERNIYRFPSQTLEHNNGSAPSTAVFSVFKLVPMFDSVPPPLDRSKDAKNNSTVAPAGSEGKNTESVSLPHITLPVGGGAIRDIGEKFDVNAVTGTGSLSIPLPLSAARSGFTPSLQLAYDSGSGNAAFGFGWSLSLPAITRKTDKGIPRYLDSEESDVFLLSGAEDLVPVIDGRAGARTHSSRTANGIAFNIYYYRPRIEGLFARIERWVDPETGLTSHWRSITRDNVTSLYGFEAASRVSDPEDPGRVFSWRLSRSWDVRGNVVSYTYVSENSINVDAAAVHEANRTPVERQTQIYLQTVAYGNVTPYFPDLVGGRKRNAAAEPMEFLRGVRLRRPQCFAARSGAGSAVVRASRSRFHLSRRLRGAELPPSKPDPVLS